jgi:hypothetical protein
MSGNEELNQLNGEEIILKIKPMPERWGKLIWGIIISIGATCSMMLISSSIWDPQIVVPMAIMALILFCITIYSGLQLYDKTLRDNRSTIYFTKTKMIIIRGEGLLSKKIKRVEFLLKEIDHFKELDDGIWIFMKRKDGVPLYSGKETEIRSSCLTRNRWIPLYGTEGLKIMENIKNILIKLIHYFRFDKN